MKAQPFDTLNTRLENGVSLIDSSAGTGKTYTIASIYPRLLLEGIAEDVSRILVVTFTNAAAQELAGRIRQRLRDCLRAMSPEAPQNEIDRDGQPDPFMEYVRSFGDSGRQILNRAIVSMDEAAVHTIHGFCRKALQEAAFESLMPLEFEFSESDMELLHSAGLDYWRRVVCNSALLLSLLDYHKLSRDILLRQYMDFSNQGECKLLPQTQPLEQMLQHCTEAAEQLKAGFSEQKLREIYQSLPELSKAKTNKPANMLQNPDEVCRQVSHALDTNDFPLPQHVLPMTREFITEAIKSKKDKETYEPSSLSLLAEGYLTTLNDCIPALRAEFFAHVSTATASAKEQNHTLSFNDLLLRLRQVLADPQAGSRLVESLRHQYQAAMIDEFQDTDPVQLEIFSRIFGSARPVYYIGDPKQAIYSFRGADIFAYLQASRQAQQHFTLGKNWRSESGMVEAVNAIFSLNAHPFVFDGIDFLPASSADKADANPLQGDNGKPLQWLTLSQNPDNKPLSKEQAADLSCTASADYIASKLSAKIQIGERNIQPGDFAVLVRTNQQAERIKQHLHEKNIPAVVGGSGNIFESNEFEQMELLLNFIAGNKASAALCGDFFGMSAAQAAFLKDDPLQYAQLARQLCDYRRIWETAGVSSMILQLMSENQVCARLLATTRGERAMTNYRHIMELLSSGPQNPHSLLRWLKLRKQQPASSEDELRLESDSDAVQIVTIHKSKGLEYGIVVCPFLWYAREEDKNAPALAHTDESTLVYDCGSDNYETHRAQMRQEQLSEDLRILYVALTRAVHRCAIVWGEIKNAQSSALGTLLTEAGDLENVLNNFPQWMEAFEQQTADAIAPAEEQQADLFNQPHRVFPQPRPIRQWSASSFSSITSSHSPATHATPVTTQPQGIHGFARGRGAPPANVAGTCLHEILELHDFQNPDTEKVSRLLKQFSLDDPSVHKGITDPVACVCDMLQKISGTLLPDAPEPVTLAESTVRMNEMPFTLPVLKLDLPHDLQEIFHEHPYGDYAGSITQQQASGFLTGIIDLVFKVGDQWYVADWKSNYLGPNNEFYTGKAIAQSVMEHHYTLQYYLYTVAVKRYLTLRLPEFDYGRDFGGVYYYYLRGVNSNESGIHFERPPASRIAHLEKLFFREPVPFSDV